MRTRSLLVAALLAPALLSAQSFDATILSYEGLDRTCDGGITPVLRIQNTGGETMMSCDIVTAPTISAMPSLHCGRFSLPLTRPLVMGIVNLTPDSFSGDGAGTNVDRALRHARSQLDAGADILDIGAESSRPGALSTPEEEELRRLLPVLREITTWGVPVSVDTYKPAVMRAALAAGVAMINDITALGHSGALEVVAASDCAICLMHMSGEPGTMQLAPRYDDVVGEVWAFLAARVANCRAAGIADDRLVVEPGFTRCQRCRSGPG